LLATASETRHRIKRFLKIIVLDILLNVDTYYCGRLDESGATGDKVSGSSNLELARRQK
jgi:hypothetical protein